MILGSVYFTVFRRTKSHLSHNKYIKVSGKQLITKTKQNKKIKMQSEAICTASSPGNSVLLIAVLHWSFFFISREENMSPICTQEQSWSQCLSPATSSDTPSDQNCFIFLFLLKEEAETHGYLSLDLECLPRNVFSLNILFCKQTSSDCSCLHHSKINECFSASSSAAQKNLTKNINRSILTPQAINTSVSKHLRLFCNICPQILLGKVHILKFGCYHSKNY